MSRLLKFSVISGFSSLFVLSGYLSPVLAYSQSDLNKLLSTNSGFRCDLSGAPLANKDLRGANLERSNLTNINLEGTNLSIDLGVIQK